MTAETDIAALEDGGANTAAEVRTALTSVLGRTTTLSRVGRTTVGASWLAPSTTKRCRKFTLSADSFITGMGVYVRSTAANVWGFTQAGMYTDDSSGTSQPGKFIAVGNGPAASDEVLFDNNVERWLYFPLNCYATAGDYWMAVFFQDPNDVQLAYDTTGGTAADLTAGGGWWTEIGATGHSFTAQTYDLSMHVLVMS